MVSSSLTSMVFIGKLGTLSRMETGNVSGKWKCPVCCDCHCFVLAVMGLD
jgi:hypothetical protein